jgi:hypothetical protein
MSNKSANNFIEKYLWRWSGPIEISDKSANSIFQKSIYGDGPIEMSKKSANSVVTIVMRSLSVY